MVEPNDFGMFKTAPRRLLTAQSKRTARELVTSCVGVVSCGKRKVRGKDGPHAAETLYTGSYVQAQIQWARSIFDKWVILSAKYGMLMPDEIVESYDQQLISMSHAQCRKWGTEARTKLLELGDRFVFVGPQLYWDWIECEPVRAGPYQLAYSAGAIIRDMASLGYEYPSIVAFLDSYGKQVGESSYRTHILKGKKQEPRNLYNYKLFKKSVHLDVQKPLASVHGSFTKTKWFYQNRDWRPA